MTFHSGQNGSATVGAIALPLVAWQVRPTAKVVEFRNSKTGQFIRRASAFKDAAVVLDIDYDFDANPFATPGLVAGATLAQVKLFVNGVAGDYWHFPSLVVDGSPQALDVRGRFITRVTCKVDGPFGYPGSPVP